MFQKEKFRIVIMFINPGKTARASKAASQKVENKIHLSTYIV